MRVGSLFAGVGGFDLAAERAGMTVVWQSENDKAASQVLADHWPDIPNYGDIHDISIRYTTAPTVDVLVGGFPCQDYSVAGTRGGLAGDRGALWWEFHRLITEGRPRWVIGENVPGILSSRGGADFATIIDSLTELGYRVGWRVLDAQYFGVAQRRRRVFIVGHSGDRSVAEVLALAEGLSGHPRPSRPEGPAVAALSRSGIGGNGGPDDNAAQAGHLIPQCAFAIQGTVIGRSDDNGPGGKGYSDDGTMFTLDTVAPHAVSASQVRRLTPLECERLQGFPDHWTATQSDTQRYRQMGNAVAVPVAEWLMQRIADQERTVT